MVLSRSDAGRFFSEEKQEIAMDKYKVIGTCIGAALKITFYITAIIYFISRI